ncbi:S-layer homology domain-containing protein [Fictibacillus nanhaiensis]|uniref:S-layer homology domain-containing protein n=1 Tax=Fictibacillus nanhaiensis TaxID=742169 RepID=UPI00203E3D8D|nr:S-layer homology domain-containing protein [Fictibacillus nanhaiensis]MCM3734221.1 S-layer homology domain-containing protein [Fictibacillus nanhaiensis]
MKKFIGGLLSAAIIAGSLASPVKAEEYKNPIDFYYPDDTWGHWAETEMLDLLQADILKGQQIEDRKRGEIYLYLNPENTVKRAEFVTMIVRALELETTKQGINFTDTKGHWAQNEINTASVLGIVNGKTATTFDPEGKITRAEIAAIVVRAFEPTVAFEKGTALNFTDLKSTHWAYDEIRKATKVGIVSGTSKTTVSPDKTAKRAEAAVMIHRALWKEEVGKPNPAQLTTFIMDNERAGYEAYNNRDIDALMLMNEQNHYGMAYTMTVDFNEMNRWWFEEMQEYEDIYKIVGEPTLTVMASSTRFAKVNVQNLKVENTFTYPEIDEETGEKTGNILNGTETQDLSGIYHLVKRDGSWKVYTNDYLKWWLYEDWEEAWEE